MVANTQGAIARFPTSGVEWQKIQIKNICHCNALYDYERFFQERAPDGAGFAPVDSILGWFPVFGPTAYVCWASTRGGTGAFWVANFHSKLKEIPGKGARGGGQRTLGTKSGWIWGGLFVDDMSGVLQHGAAAWRPHCLRQQLTSVTVCKWVAKLHQYNIKNYTVRL